MASSSAGALGALTVYPSERSVGDERLIRTGDMVIERAKRRVTLAGTPVNLTPK